MINTSLRKSIPTNTWSTEDIRQLRQLAVAGASLDTISVTLRRTRSAIRNKATMHGISLKRCTGGLSSPLPTHAHPHEHEHGHAHEHQHTSELA